MKRLVDLLTLAAAVFLATANFPVVNAQSPKTSPSTPPMGTDACAAYKSDPLN